MIRVKFLEDAQPSYKAGQQYSVGEEFGRLMVTARKAEFVRAPSTAGTDNSPPPSSAGLIGKAVATAGLRGCIIGASIEARANPCWDFARADYQRINGEVTLTFAYALADKAFLPGQRVRVTANKDVGIEGSFDITSSSFVANTSTTVKYLDPRPDVPANSMIGSGGLIHDLQAWTCSGGFPVHLNMHLDARADLTVIATGGTNIITDWGVDRIQQVADQGPFDFVVIGAGACGNAIKVYGAGPAAVTQALRNTIELVRDLVRPRLIFVESLPNNRDVTPTGGMAAIWTAGQRFNRALWKLQSEYPFVRVIPGGETMVSNFSAYNVAPSADVSNGHPEANMLGSDGVHSAYAWAALRGAVMADSLLPHIAPWPSPEMGILPDTATVATTPDVEGGKIANYLPGLWGNVDTGKVTIASAGCTGVGPATASMSFTAGRGSSTAVGTLVTDPMGGADWEIVINGSGSSTGYTFQCDLAPPALLTALNGDLQGKLCDLYLPLDLSLAVENGLIWADVSLLATVGGVQYLLAAPMGNIGQYSQASLGRAMDGGFAGVLTPPRFRVPAVAYTAAVLRVTLKEVNGNVPSGRTVLRWGAGQRLQLVGD